MSQNFGRKAEINRNTTREVTPMPPTDDWPGGGEMTRDGTVYMRKLVRKGDKMVPGPLRKVGKV